MYPVTLFIAFGYGGCWFPQLHSLLPRYFPCVLPPVLSMAIWLRATLTPEAIHSQATELLPCVFSLLEQLCRSQTLVSGRLRLMHTQCSTHVALRNRSQGGLLTLSFHTMSLSWRSLTCSNSGWHVPGKAPALLTVILRATPLLPFLGLQQPSTYSISVFGLFTWFSSLYVPYHPEPRI